MAHHEIDNPVMHHLNAFGFIDNLDLMGFQNGDLHKARRELTIQLMNFLWEQGKVNFILRYPDGFLIKRVESADGETRTLVEEWAKFINIPPTDIVGWRARDELARSVWQVWCDSQNTMRRAAEESVRWI